MVLICISLIMSEKRSYPTSVVRGSSREYQAVTAQEQPRGVTPHQRSGGTAERSYPASEIRGSGKRGYPTPLSPRPGAMGRRSYPTLPRLRSRAVARRSNPTPEARGGGWEDQPHVQGAVAVRAQEGLEELSHVEGQEGRW